MNYDAEIKKTQDAIDRVKAKVAELQDKYDSIIDGIPCGFKEKAANALPTLKSAISKGQKIISDLTERIRKMNCLKDRKTAARCLSNKKSDSKKTGRDGGDGGAGRNGESPKGKSNAERLRALQECIKTEGEKGKNGRKK
jgi:adenine specific DNA methylase Mod